MNAIEAAVSFYFRYVLRRPTLIKRAMFYVPDTWSLFATGLNEVKYLLKRETGYRVTCVAVELSAHCNLDCLMCARHSVMKRDQGHMSLEVFQTLVDGNPEVPAYILVGWGEAMLNPIFFDALGHLRRRGKRIALTTNATLLTSGNIERLLEYRPEAVTISLDGMGQVYESLRGVPYDKVEEKVIAFAKAYKDRVPHAFFEINSIGTPETLALAPRMRQRLGPLVDDIRFSSYVEYNKLLPTNRTQPCRELWRGMISVLHDGRVVPCCMDYNATMVLGRVEEAPLNQLWNNDLARKFRREQLRGEFKRRCATCYEAPPPEGVDRRFA